MCSLNVDGIWSFKLYTFKWRRATSYTRLRAPDNYTSSTLIGAEGGADSTSGTNGVMCMQDGYKSLHGFLHGIEWIVFHGHLDCFQKPPLGGRPNIKALPLVPMGAHWVYPPTKWAPMGTKCRAYLTVNHETMALANTHDRWFILFDHVWASMWMETHSTRIWLRARSQMTTLEEDPWPDYMILEVSWDGPLDTFVWALAISWSRLLARAWRGP